jgi:hypothetical protein
MPARQVALAGTFHGVPEIKQHDHAEFCRHAGERDEADAPAIDNV